MPDQALCLDPASSAGVTLVGAGPGDPDLITIAGLKALLGADVVVTDRLVSHELLARLAPDVELIDVAKFPRSRFTAQEDINAVLLDRARAGMRVVRLKGGDSHVFGRGFEEVRHLQQAGVPVRVIPGLSSSISVPALAGIPVTHRGVVHDFTVVSGHVPPRHPESLVNWDALAASRGTIVLMMAVQNAAVIPDPHRWRTRRRPVRGHRHGRILGERAGHPHDLGSARKVDRDREGTPAGDHPDRRRRRALTCSAHWLASPRVGVVVTQNAGRLCRPADLLPRELARLLRSSHSTREPEASG